MLPTVVGRLAEDVFDDEASRQHVSQLPSSAARGFTPGSAFSSFKPKPRSSARKLESDFGRQPKRTETLNA